MAITNRDRVEKALELVCDGLKPFISRELTDAYGPNALDSAKALLGEDGINSRRLPNEWDVSALFKLIMNGWSEVFGRGLGPAERGYIGELRGHRNNWAHSAPFSGRDTLRVLDTAQRLMVAVAAPQADELEKMERELRRLQFEEEARAELRKNPTSNIEGAATGQLKPWREIVMPHPDVSKGTFQQAEFAADLYQVHQGEGAPEYLDPAEFFRRTFLTSSLKQMLVSALRRLSGQGGDPVVQLQTNFGGGKTHSMLSLYHLVKGTDPKQLLGVEEVMSEAGVATLPRAKTVVLVGHKLRPGHKDVKPDGTVVHTIWGELAYQLGGKEAYERIRQDDENATSPGDALRGLFNDYGPCLILIDEWVAYARQLHDKNDVPAGDFETQFSFAQALTESAKLARNCLLVISLPASDVATNARTKSDDVEVGGLRGRQALDRLQNVIGRVESAWRPATAEESFEIVSRRLFQPIAPDKFRERDSVARAFYETYRSAKTDFPSECAETSYLNRIKAAYPIHPEVFDRLYTDWSTLVKFQRTRGVLRLMASVIHSLWESGDRNPLILPSLIPIDNPRVMEELIRYLPEAWGPIIAKDVDGPNSLPIEIERSAGNLGKGSIVRRVARTVYLGSAPLTEAAHRGLEDRRINLGCVMPGESASIFGDALRRLSNKATYLYQDGNRYWYSTQPTLIKVAEDLAESFKRNPEAVSAELEKRIKQDIRDSGDFHSVIALPESGASVLDTRDAKLIILGPTYEYIRGGSSRAEVQARLILEMRGTSPRLFRNSLVFIAPDSARVPELDEAIRRYLAWESILEDADQKGFNGQQIRQAEAQLKAASSAVNTRIPETYQWLMVPQQSGTSAPIEFDISRIGGQEPLATRASKKLRSSEKLLTSLGARQLRTEMDNNSLWKGNHIPLRELADYFAQYPALSRLKTSNVLLDAVRNGVSVLVINDTFALAEGYDEAQNRYNVLHAGTAPANLEIDSFWLLVKPNAAIEQMERDAPKPVPTLTPIDVARPWDLVEPDPVSPAAPQSQPTQGPKHFHGSISLNPLRAGYLASQIAEEILVHLTSLPGANVTISLDISADIPEGASDQVVRTVTENCRALKFDPSTGFEAD